MKLTDVTLREGDQMPGRNYSVEQKVESARLLDTLGIEFIQPGFPAIGEKDQTVMDELAGTLQADVVALARALTGDIDLALDANADVVEIFVPVSDLHLEHLLGSSREDMVETLSEAVDYVYDHGGEAHVTLADGFRTDADDLITIFEAVPQAEYITLADTVGARTPKTVETLLDELEPNVDFSRLGVHFHNDLGHATANALTAYDRGVSKADVSIASLGERAGNSCLEEVVVACATDREESLNVNESRLVPVCREILDTLDEEINDRKAILGEEISEHESGIHTAAMLKEPATLEPFDPARFGGVRQLLFGASTGANGAQQVLKRADIEFDGETVAAFEELLSERGPLTLEESLEAANNEYGD
jgi:isopropylmalate/homocitrate/citramalate synthase